MQTQGKNYKTYHISSHSFLDVYAVSGAHLMYQAGFLTCRSSFPPPSRTFGWCNGYWSSLPAYSDQFAQDFHLIPSFKAPTNKLCTWYCNIQLHSIIIMLCYFYVNTRIKWIPALFLLEAIFLTMVQSEQINLWNGAVYAIPLWRNSLWNKRWTKPAVSFFLSGVT